MKTEYLHLTLYAQTLYDIIKNERQNQNILQKKEKLRMALNV